MNVRAGLLLIFVLGASWIADARHLNSYVSSKNSSFQISYQEQKNGIYSSATISSKENVCKLCEEYTTQAVEYLTEDKTQTEVIDILHTSCSRFHSFKQECVTLVDYYVPIFFLELSSIQPEDFCQKVKLCEKVVVTSVAQYKDSCGLCHYAVSEVLIRLKDPDTQLEIMELLLKGCDATENYAKKCKQMVFQYAPTILANMEQLLDSTDICATLHACSPTTGRKQSLLLVKALLLADS